MLPDKQLIKKSSTLIDKAMEDWMRGTYHVALKSNLHVTHDFNEAVERARRQIARQADSHKPKA